MFLICLTKVIFEASYTWENLLSQGHQVSQKKGEKSATVCQQLWAGDSLELRQVTA